MPQIDQQKRYLMARRHVPVTICLGPCICETCGDGPLHGKPSQFLGPPCLWLQGNPGAKIVFFEEVSQQPCCFLFYDSCFLISVFWFLISVFQFLLYHTTRCARCLCWGCLVAPLLGKHVAFTCMASFLTCMCPCQEERVRALCTD